MNKNLNSDFLKKINNNKKITNFNKLHLAKEMQNNNIKKGI